MKQITEPQAAGMINMLIAFIHQIRRDLRSPSPKIRGAAASFFRGDAKKNLTLQAISMIVGRTPQWIREKIKTGGKRK